ncbi:MAG: alpha/beta hydrolase [Pseudomonadota bacterium]
MSLVPESLRDPRIQTRFVQTKNLRFEVDQCLPESASDRLALCLHGFPEHSFSWRHQLPLLADLGYQAWAPNLRGYGASDRPAGQSAYAIEYLLEDVADLIDACGAQEVVLLAHDWGAVIAWYFAMRQIRPLNQLVICNVPHPQAMQNNFSWAQVRRSWYIFFFQIPGLAERLLGRADGAAFKDMMRKSMDDPQHFPPEAGEVYRNNAMQPGALNAMINYYRALVAGGGARRQAALGFPVIDTPTLMVWGEADQALGKETTYGTDRYVSDLTLRYLPRVSHWVQQEQPHVVNAMLKAFLLGETVPEMCWQPDLVLPQPAAVDSKPDISDTSTG